MPVRHHARSVKAALCLLLLLPVACSTPDDAPEKLAAVPGVTAVAVSLPEGGDNTIFEYALTAALGDRDLPAYFSRNTPAKSDRLAITGMPPLFHVSLSDSEGREIGAFDAFLYAGDIKLEMRRTADRIAERVAAILLPATQTRSPQPSMAHVVILHGEGAPGDGNEALALAMTQMMEGKVPLDSSASPQNYAISVKVSRKPDSKMEQIALDWTISDPKGREIAHIGQSNSVAPGSLDHHWGGIAYDAALAASRALLPIIRALPPEPPP